LHAVGAGDSEVLAVGRVAKKGGVEWAVGRRHRLSGGRDLALGVDMVVGGGSPEFRTAVGGVDALAGDFVGDDPGRQWGRSRELRHGRSGSLRALRIRPPDGDDGPAYD